MKREIPLIITFVMGFIMFFQFFVPTQSSDLFLEEMNNWGRIIGTFSLLLGVGSVLHLHINRIKRKVDGWYYSILTLSGLFITAFFGIFFGKEEGSFTYWLYSNIQAPIEGTMFSLLAFFIASAAYRAFRARNWTSTALLVSAVIVMLGQVPIGDKIMQILHLDGIISIKSIAQWLLDCPNSAAKRAIQLGVGLGMTATSLKMILGIERSYLGSGN